MKGLLEINKHDLMVEVNRLNQLHEVDLAAYMETLDSEEFLLMSHFLEKKQLAEAFAELSHDYKQEMMNHLNDEDLRVVVHHLDSMELVDTIKELPANLVKRLLGQLDGSKRSLINQLLGYPEESVGSIMGVEMVKCLAEEDQAQILTKLSNSKFDPEYLQIIWMIDHNQHLVGYLYLSDLIRYPHDDLNTIIQTDVISVKTLDDQEFASNIMNKYHLSLLPVTDEEGCLVGVVSADIMLDVMEEEFSEDMASMQGMGGIDEDYLKVPAFVHFKKRIVWLLILMVTATLTGYIIQRYDAILSGSVILAAYIPMLMDSGGNAGGQATTVIIRSLTLGEVALKDAAKIFLKEFEISIMVGICMALLNMIRIMVMDQVSMMVNLTVSLSLLLTIIMAKLVGSMLPLVGTFFKQDPVVMAGPLLTTVVDTLSLLIYFEIASLLLGL